MPLLWRPWAAPPSTPARFILSRDPYPSLARTVGLLVGTLLAAAVLAGATMALFPDWPDILQMAVPTEIALAAAVMYAIRRTGLSWRDALGFHAMEARALAPLALIVIGSVAVFSELYVVIQRIVPVPEAFESMLRDLLQMDGSVDFMFTLLVAVIVAPALEEALFRGVILQGLARRYGPHTASFWTAAFFALFHLYNPWQILPTFLLGLILAWLVLSTRSLVASMVAHSVFNGVSLGIAGASLNGTLPDEIPETWLLAGIVLTLIAASVALLVGLVWLEKQTGGGWFAESGDEPPPGMGDDPLGRQTPYAAGSSSAEGRAGPFTARG